MRNHLTEKEIIKLPFRGRGLKEFERLVCDVLAFVNVSKTKPFKILEIGCGFGQLLVELAAVFGKKIDLHGINLEPSSIDLEKAQRIAKHKGVVPLDYFVPNDGIKFTSCDAGVGIPFPDKYFDLVLSQMSFIYIYDKAKAIEEVGRVLKDNGIGLLWVGFESDNRKEGYWSTLEIYRGAKLIGLADYFKNFPNLEYEMRPTGSILRVTHSDDMELGLKLKSSVGLTEFNRGWCGFKSIYHV